MMKRECAMIMKITPIAFDSLGTRSMATFVETSDVKILIDPSVSLAPSRFGLPPHSREIKKFKEDRKKIKELAKKADVLIVTHYHYDHYNPEEPNVFKGKTVLLKHPTDHINKSQQERAEYFLHQLANKPKKTEFADGREFVFGATRIVCSPPVFHGTNEKLGFVFEVLVEEGKEKFVFTSDVEGPSQQDQLDFILKHKPQTVFLDGPLSYLLYIFGNQALGASIQNMINVLEAGVETLVVDHHFLRDAQYLYKLQPVLRAAEKKKARVITAAEFAGKKPNPLETMRKQLYEKWPEKAKKKGFEAEE